ncbi:MAG: hypothetical protein MASP_01776 [Candidatus Methanolliviera sp. GoM_asphalt]|nr:MAG: hypothetical protein MASP_01776 [Candidatus Methanolliviera sp. GoM_asphalt]
MISPITSSLSFSSLTEMYPSEAFFIASFIFSASRWRYPLFSSIFLSFSFNSVILFFAAKIIEFISSPILRYPSGIPSRSTLAIKSPFVAADRTSPNDESAELRSRSLFCISPIISPIPSIVSLMISPINLNSSGSEAMSILAFRSPTAAFPSILPKCEITDSRSVLRLLSSSIFLFRDSIIEFMSSPVGLYPSEIFDRSTSTVKSPLDVLDKTSPNTFIAIFSSSSLFFNSVRSLAV